MDFHFSSIEDRLTHSLQEKCVLSKLSDKQEKHYRLFALPNSSANCGKIGSLNLELRLVLHLGTGRHSIPLVEEVYVYSFLNSCLRVTLSVYILL